MAEVQHENNETIEQIQALEKIITEKIQRQGSQDDGRSIIRFSKDHWVEFDEYGCLSAIKFHPEHLPDNSEELEASITYPKRLPYCTNIIFNGGTLYVQDQIITKTEQGFQHLSQREGFEGLPIEVTTQITVDDPAIVLKYYQSLENLIDQQLSRSSDIQEALES